MVLKTGSDRPVQPETSTLFSPVLQKNQKFRKNRQKPETGGLTVKTANRSGWTGFGPIPLIPKLHRFGLLFLDPNPNFSLSFFHLFASRSPLASLSLTPLSPSRSRSLHLCHLTNLWKYFFSVPCDKSGSFFAKKTSIGMECG